MKLVDILARELKVWPEGYESLQQSFAGMVFHGAKDGILPIVRLSVAEDFRTTAVTRAQWQAAVDAMGIPKFPSDDVERTGEGLPPIGSHVVVHDDGSLMYGQGESGEVLAHVDGCAVIRMSYGLGCFLPRCLRTPEQVAAEERQAAIKEMIGHIGGSRRCEAEVLYDAGYRKQVSE